MTLLRWLYLQIRRWSSNDLVTICLLSVCLSVCLFRMTSSKVRSHPLIPLSQILATAYFKLPFPKQSVHFHLIPVGFRWKNGTRSFQFSTHADVRDVLHLPGEGVRQRGDADSRQQRETAGRRQAGERLVGVVVDDARLDSEQPAVDAFNRHTQPPQQVLVERIQTIYEQQHRRHHVYGTSSYICRSHDGQNFTTFSIYRTFYILFG